MGAGEGLFSTKLQDGYTKLLITADISGIPAVGMTPIGTSQVDTHISTGFYMGQDNVMGAGNLGSKFIANVSNTKFLSIESVNSAPGTGQNGILDFYSGQANGIENSTAHLSSVLQVNMEPNSAGVASKGLIMFGQTSDLIIGTQGTTTWGSSEIWGPSVPYASIGGSTLSHYDVIFNMGMDNQRAGSTNWWYLDRVKIGSLGYPAESVTAGQIIPAFDATEVPVSYFTGINSTGVMDLIGGVTIGSGTGEKLSLKADDDIHIKADGNLWLEDSSAIYIEAMRDTGGAGILINAFQNNTANSSEPYINIGTIDEVSRTIGKEYDLTGGTAITASGTHSINIGVAGGSLTNGVDQQLNIYPYKTFFKEGFVVLEEQPAPGAGNQYLDFVTTVPSNNMALYAQKASSSVGDSSLQLHNGLINLGYTDGTHDKDYVVETVERGKSKILVLEDIDETNTDPPSGVQLNDQTAQIYVRSGKLVIAYDHGGTAKWLTVDLSALTKTGATSAVPMG